MRIIEFPFLLARGLNFSESYQSAQSRPVRFQSYVWYPPFLQLLSAATQTGNIVTLMSGTMSMAEPWQPPRPRMEYGDELQRKLDLDRAS